MPKIISRLILCLFVMNIQAQSQKHCSTTEIMNTWLNADPARKAAFEHQQQLAKTADSLAFLNGYKNYSKAAAVPAYTIPVVFHVLHLNGPENISDAQIQDAVAVLNLDYRKLNADTASIVPPFKPLAADVNFQFALATLDPSGNCTNGITRHYTTKTNWKSNSFSEYIYTWPPTMYLNVYVVKNIDNGSAGYTYLPGTAGGNADAIVILSNYIGRIGTGNTFVSRALTHEVGHWFNLSHVWGNTNQPGVACGDDGVSDTPVTKGFQNCSNTMPSVCNTPTVENIQNYMEYAFCSKMFTIGQATRMNNAVIGGPGGRNNVVSASNLMATGVTNPVSPCAPKAEFNVNTGIGCVGSNFTFQDLSYNGTVSNWQWTFPTGSPSVSTLQNPSTSFSSSGTKTVTLKVSNAQGADSIIKTVITVVAGPGSGVTNLVQSFETISFPDNIWIASTPQYGSGWTQNNLAATTGSTSIYINNYFDNPNEAALFYTPMFDISGMTNPAISFKVAYAQKSSTNADRLKVYYSTACGNPWTILYSKNGSNLQTMGTGSYSPISGFTPNPSQWRKEFVDLTSVGTSTNLVFKFEFTPDSANPGNNIFIDDINIETNTGINSYEKENAFISVSPNPLSHSTQLSFVMLQKNNVRIEVYDLTGKKVKQLLNRELEKGEYNYNFEAGDLNKGLYFVEFRMGEALHTKKIIIQ